MPLTSFPTPNPHAHKYTLDRPVGATMRNFGSAEEAAGHPLAQALFRLSGVSNVFLTANFITVNKRPDVAWESLEPDIVAVISAYYTLYSALG